MPGPTAVVTQGTVFEDYSATFRDRVLLDGEPILRADISSMSYTVTDTQTNTAVTSHDNVTLTIADVIFDTLQEDAAWPYELGYNFKLVLAKTAFPEGGRKYKIEVTVIPSASHAFPVHFLVDCNSTLRS